MRYSPVTSPTSSTFGCSGISVSFSRKVFVCLKFEARAHEGIFVGYATNSHAYRVLNKSNGLTRETCNVEFDENNGSQVEQSGTCDVGDEIPPQAIRRMGVGVATRPQMACAAVHQCHPWISNADTHSTNGGFITE